MCCDPLYSVPSTSSVLVDDSGAGYSARRDALLRAASAWPATLGQFEKFRENGGTPIPRTEK